MTVWLHLQSNRINCVFKGQRPIHWPYCWVDWRDLTAGQQAYMRFQLWDLNHIITEEPVSWSGVPEASGPKPFEIFALTKTKALDEGGLEFNQQIYFPWRNGFLWPTDRQRIDAMIIPVTRDGPQSSLLLENTSSYMSEPALSRWQTPNSPAAS